MCSRVHSWVKAAILSSASVRIRNEVLFLNTCGHPVRKPRINLKMKLHTPSSLALLTSLLGIIVMQFLPWMKGGVNSVSVSSKRLKKSAMVPLMFAIQILHHHKCECQRLVVILSFLWQQHSGGAFQTQWDNEWS